MTNTSAVPDLRKAQNIIGLPVLDVATGKQLGKVKDFLIDETWRVYAILMETKGWLSSAVKAVKSSDVIAFGEDAVTILNEEAVRQADDLPFVHTILSGGKKLKDLPVVTFNGNELGVVTDVYFSADQGMTIKGYELTDGFVSDIIEGRKWLPVPEQITVGDDAIMVPVHCDHDLKQIITFNDE